MLFTVITEVRHCDLGQWDLPRAIIGSHENTRSSPASQPLVSLVQPCIRIQVYRLTPFLSLNSPLESNPSRFQISSTVAQYGDLNQQPIEIELIQIAVFALTALQH